MKNQQRPETPRDNPSLKSGMYDAVVDEVLEETYGNDDSPMIRIVFRIPAENAYFCTHIYFPGNYSLGSKRRLWHFCQCVGRAVGDIEWNPNVFAGCPLRLTIIHNTPATASPYSDVEAFLPAQSEADDAKSEPERVLRCSWIRPLSEAV